MMTKKDIYERLGYTSMTPVYNKYITTDKIAQELGFDCLEKFKSARKFTLEQTRKTNSFLDLIVQETGS